MKTLSYTLLFLLLCFTASSQSTSHLVAVKAKAELVEKPWPSILLSWEDDFVASKWSIYKKNNLGEFTLLSVIGAPDTSYVDDDIKPGNHYTYLIHKENVSDVLGFSVITAGYETKLTLNHGACLLLIEDSIDKNLNRELETFKKDLYNEGWTVYQEIVSANKTHFDLKNIIKNSYTNSDSTITSMVLIGDLAVPYSGNIAPDGHTAAAPPDHQGAWPADVYYGDLDGKWTDNSVALQNSPARTENTNRKNDGKFDQSIIPSDIELMVGRIFLEKFDSYEKNRYVLYKRYFDRNHAFRTNAYTFKNKAIVNDDFTNLYEGFAGIGHRNFGLAVGNNNIIEGSLAEHAIENSALFAYGCGPGDYDKSGRRLRDNNGKLIDSFKISQTDNYFEYEINCGFNILFGSFFGDWDSENNLLRAPLAGKSPALATFWAGRPVWHLNEFIHGMPLGYSARTSQNSDVALFSSIESTFTYERMVHVALMGDPTLKLRYIKPVQGLKIETNETRDEVSLSWDKHELEQTKYYVLKKSIHKDSIEWKLVSEIPINQTNLLDKNPIKGSSVYRVIPAYMFKGATGSFEVAGHSDTISIDNIKLNVGVTPLALVNLNLSVYPNPTNNQILVKTNLQIDNLQIRDLSGRLLATYQTSSSKSTIINISSYKPGTYLLIAQYKNSTITKRILIY